MVVPSVCEKNTLSEEEENVPEVEDGESRHRYLEGCILDSSTLGINKVFSFQFFVLVLFHPLIPVEE